MAGIFSIDGDMNDRPNVFAVMPLHFYGIHHLGVAHANRPILHLGFDALSGYLLHLAQLAAIGSLVREGITQRSPNGMRGVMLHMGGKMQQMPFVTLLGMHRSDSKLAMGQGARLIENHCIHLR